MAGLEYNLSIGCFRNFRILCIPEGICQEPPVKDWWHGDATLRVVLEHTQNSTSVSNHSLKTSGILMFKDSKEEELRPQLKYQREIPTAK